MRSSFLDYALLFVLWSVLASCQSLEPLGTEVNLPSTITPAPATTQCPPCQVLVSAGGGGMSRVFWWNSTLDLTLNTVSVVVTQYNNTAITGTTTVSGDLNLLDPYDFSEARILQDSFTNPQYPNQPAIQFVNDTNGLVEGSLSFPYPTSYLVIPGYIYYTQTASSGRGSGGCPAGQSLDGQNRCACRLATAVADGYGIYPEFSANDTQIGRTFYATMATVDGLDLGDQLKNNIISYDVAPFSSWLAPIISPRPPQFDSCYFPPAFVGPPALKVPVSALTATVTTTVHGTDRYSWTTATPALTASHELPAETSMPATDRKNEPSVRPQSAPGMSHSGDTSASGVPKDPQTRTLASPPSQIVSGRSTYTLDPSSDYVIASKVLTEGDYDPKTSGTPISLAVGDEIVFTGSSIQFSPEQNLLTTHVMSIFGSTYTMDKSSNLIVEGQKITPGGAFTVSGSVISVPIIDGSESMSFPAQTLIRTPIVSFLGSTYAMDMSSNLVIEGQTVTPGVAFTVSGSVISVPVIESSPAQTLLRTPVVSFLGSTFTMDMSSNFVLDGQTVKPGSAITVSGSAISLPTGGSLFVVGGITETLSQAIMTAEDGRSEDAPPTSRSVADSAIDSRTPIQTSVITSSTTPVFEETNTATDDKITGGNPGEQIASGNPMTGGTAGTSANPVDTDEVSSTASASGFRPILLVVFGLCVSLGLVSTST